jgi:hypothetical protein
MFTSGTVGGPGGPERDYRDMTIITGLKFIDGGSGNDTVVAITLNRSSQAFNITSGCVEQSYWLNNGTVYIGHEQTAELFGDLTVPINATKDIHLSLPKDTLIAGKTYSVGLVTDQNPQHGEFKYDESSQNFFSVISAPEAFVFYHMRHPSSSSPVEEGVITSLAAGYYPYNYGDVIGAEVQNTGDFPITITGGFVNGVAAINTTDSSIHLTGVAQCVIEKNATGSVTLNFPALSLYNQMQNNIPFNVKLVTSEGSIIEYPDTYYYPFLSNNPPFYGRIQQPATVKEQAVITDIKFSHVIGNDDTIAVTFHNSGSNPITISSSLLNGKATTILPNNTIVDPSSTQTITLQAGTLMQGSKYQVVLISKENNAFITTSTYSPL